MANAEEAKIYIIGAGVSGLIAAANLEKQGYHPIILEADDRVGGRVKTDIVHGYQLDRGFQVLLDAYPYAQKYLNYEALELQSLSPGAILYKNGKGVGFGDPMRDSSYLASTLFTGLASISDKLKVYQLRSALQQTSLEEIFDHPELTTDAYLKSKGFSDKVISNFFRPFFAGIYLENRLETSSRMFEFVYKLFAEGNAVIPKEGIEAISRQLASQLRTTEIRLNTSVAKLKNQEIVLRSGEKLRSDFTIVATNPEELIDNYASSLSWKSCDTLYFTTKTRTIQKPIIGLNCKTDALVNNIFYPTSLATSTAGDLELLSTTVVTEHPYSRDELIEKVFLELRESFGIKEASFLKHYKIPYALPSVQNLKYRIDPSECLLREKVALAGDHLLNGSLNAAMQSGEASATIAHLTLSESILALG